MDLFAMLASLKSLDLEGGVSDIKCFLEAKVEADRKQTELLGCLLSAIKENNELLRDVLLIR